MRTGTGPVWAAILAATTSVALVAGGCEGPGAPAHATDGGCFGCHGDRYEATTDPAHAALRFPEDCERCHDTADWSRSTLVVHPEDGAFPLLGAHRGLACAVCHGERSDFGGLTGDCWGCHEADYRGASTPDHEAADYPRTCLDCHDTEGWRPAGGSAHQPGGTFPLEGGHGGLGCARCHDLADFAAVPRACWGCHEADYRGTVSPDHAAEAFPRTCADCHTTAAWTPALPPQHGEGGVFPLTQGHGGLACADCHDVTDFAAVSPECVACHRADYDATSDPDHAAQAFPTRCADCHTPAGWRPALPAAHDAGGAFPLEGGHTAPTCSDCHDVTDFAAVSPECVACHRADYDATTDPDHAAQAFPTACDACHTPAAWRPAMASEHLPGGSFPLEGGHAAPTCSDCHDVTDFGAVSPACVACHRSDYDATTNPDHGALTLPTGCAECHGIGGWQPAELGRLHRFPIDSGRHRGLRCDECHLTETWAAFSCIDCHEHRREEADDEHLGDVAGYEYATAACYECHPRGVAEDD